MKHLSGWTSMDMSHLSHLCEYEVYGEYMKNVCIGVRIGWNESLPFSE